MARKILGQAYPGPGQLIDLYTVPGGKSATGSSVVACNQGTTEASFRIAVAKAGASGTSKQYLYYDTPISARDSFIATIGFTLSETDVLRCYSATGLVSFNVFGDES